ncbi:MAG: hypothetical protein DRJ69_05120 [Thermoprotei archaeon]|nr:MAG: hypothetical protein DRJ69_05120 [Thermoprotei archaeon]
MDALKAFEGSVLVLGEVQELASPQILKVLKRAWDTYPGLRLVFTGSLTGVLKALRGAMIVSEQSGLYYIPDPVTRGAVQQLKA